MRIQDALDEMARRKGIDGVARPASQNAAGGGIANLLFSSRSFLNDNFGISFVDTGIN